MIGLIMMLSAYLFVLVSVDLLHNHDADFDFHDNCPACQWSQQAFEDDAVLQGMYSALDLIHVHPPVAVYEEAESHIPTLLVPTTLTRRGPPHTAA